MATLAEKGNGGATGAVLNERAAQTLQRGLPEPLHRLALRRPILALFVLLIASNVTGSIFNVYYNVELIVPKMTDAQKWAFQSVAIPLYNVIAYPLGFGVFLFLCNPLRRCLHALRSGAAIDPARLEFCRRRVVRLPQLQLGVNAAVWLPGAIFFPAMVGLLGGGAQAGLIWQLFGISFIISAAFTTVQTFFILEWFLVAYLYPEFFRDVRPEDVPGIRYISYRWRLGMLWMAVAFMPFAALFFALFDTENGPLAFTLFLAAAVSSFAIFSMVGGDLLQWVRVHAAATGEIGRGNFDVRIDEQRPDEWGRLTNRFNDMAGALGRARELRETFGQFVSPAVRDEILAHIPGLEVTVQEVTVVFADIRGFTRRCAGEPPERVGLLLNRFLTLALRAVEEKGGLVNKFLGDGFMALFGATRQSSDHADLALASAQDLLVRLDGLNSELLRQGQAPLAVGVGIHTGPALVGCFGATLESDDGSVLMRREFTAIGETVNLCQRLEQLTKTCGGPILISEETRCRLQQSAPMHCLGPQSVPGAPQPVVVHRTGTA
jgi:adenylate cyclase